MPMWLLGVVLCVVVLIGVYAERYVAWNTKRHFLQSGFVDFTAFLVSNGVSEADFFECAKAFNIKQTVRVVGSQRLIHAKCAQAVIEAAQSLNVADQKSKGSAANFAAIASALALGALPILNSDKSPSGKKPRKAQQEHRLPDVKATRTSGEIIAAYEEDRRRRISKYGEAEPDKHYRPSSVPTIDLSQIETAYETLHAISWVSDQEHCIGRYDRIRFLGLDEWLRRCQDVSEDALDLFEYYNRDRHYNSRNRRFDHYDFDRLPYDILDKCEHFRRRSPYAREIEVLMTERYPLERQTALDVFCYLMSPRVNLDFESEGEELPLARPEDEGRYSGMLAKIADDPPAHLAQLYAKAPNAARQKIGKAALSFTMAESLEHRVGKLPSSTVFRRPSAEAQLKPPAKH